MKFLVSAAFAAVVTGANGKTFKCADSYPPGDMSLMPPAGQEERARIRPSFLSMAYLYAGELYGEQYLVGPDVAHSKGGMDIQHGFQPEDKKWLVCVYGGNEWNVSKQLVNGPVQLWKRLDSKITSCVLSVHKVKASVDLLGWNATATCR